MPSITRRKVLKVAINWAIVEKEWKKERMMKERKNERKKEWMKERLNKWKKDWMNERKIEWMKEWMNEWLLMTLDDYGWLLVTLDVHL